MDRVSVVSSSIESVGYDEVSAVLEVEFKSGAIYRYLNVPAVVQRDLMSAPSVGAYFNKHVKARYAFEQVS